MSHGISQATQIRVALIHPFSYPLYPLAWLQYLSKAQNIAREQERGTLVDALDAVVSDPADPVTVATPDGVLPATDYPAAYTSILALDAEPLATTPTTISTPSSFIATPIQSSIGFAAPVQSSPAPATPSDAIIIYRRDVCEIRAPCSSFAMEYNITPGASVNTCTQEADYTQDLHAYLASDTKNYSISVGPFTSHSLTGCEYAGTNDEIGSISCSNNFEQTCSSPTSTQAVKCNFATDTPIVYAEW